MKWNTLRSIIDHTDNQSAYLPFHAQLLEVAGRLSSFPALAISDVGRTLSQETGYAEAQSDEPMNTPRVKRLRAELIEITGKDRDWKSLISLLLSILQTDSKDHISVHEVLDYSC